MASAVAVAEDQSRADEPLFEVVDGVRVELPPMGFQEVRLANRLAQWLWEALGPLPRGEVLVEMLFRLAPNAKRDRRPDVAFVPPEQLAALPPGDEGDALPVVPALAVEIVSKSNTAGEIRGKIDEYFIYGVSLVWVIYPKQRKVDVFEGPKCVRVLDADDTLDGGSVLPAFRLPVARFFELLPTF